MLIYYFVYDLITKKSITNIRLSLLYFTVTLVLLTTIYSVADRDNEENNIINYILKKEKSVKHVLIIACVNSIKFNWKAEVETHTNETGYILGTRITKKGREKTSNNKRKGFIKKKWKYKERYSHRKKLDKEVK